MTQSKKPTHHPSSTQPIIDSYFDIPLSTSTQQSPPPSVPYSPAYSDPGSRAGSSTRTGSVKSGSTPAFSDEEIDVDQGNRLRSRSYHRRRRRGGALGKEEGAASSIGGLGVKLGMTGILPLTTRTRLTGVKNEWKQGRGAPGGMDSIDILTEDDDDDDDRSEGDADDEAGNLTRSGPLWGSHIVIEQGALLLTTSAAWEEAFHPLFGLMRRGRGGVGGAGDEGDEDEGVKGILTDERLETIGDEVEWLVIDLRIVSGREEYRTRAEVMGGPLMTGSTRPTMTGPTRCHHHHGPPHSSERTTSRESITSTSSPRSRNPNPNPNPAHLPKVHKLTFLGSEYAEIMHPSRAAMVKEVVRELKGLLAVEWLPSHEHPAQSTSSSFSPAPFTPSFSTSSRTRAAIDSTTVTFPTCLVPQDLIDAGKRWNINWNRRPEGDFDWRNGHLPEAEEGGKVRFPTTVEEAEVEDTKEPAGERRGSEVVEQTGPRSTGHRFYSDVSEKQREEEGTLSEVAISPLQWLGGLRCLKVQGGFPVPQPDESLGLVKPDYSFAFKPWIGECGVETLVWSFQGSYTETTTMTILKHLFKFVTITWTRSCQSPANCETRPACSLLVLQAVHPNVITKLRNTSDQLTRRRVGLRVEDDVPADAFEWLRDVVFLEDKVPVEGEDRQVPRLTRLWDTADEEENIRLDMDQARALVRLKAEVLAHARAGRGAKPRPVRSKRVKPPKPLDWAALRERKGDLRLDLSERTARRDERRSDDKPLDMLSPPKTASTIRPGPTTSGLTARLPNTHQVESAGVSRSSSYTTDPGTMADSLVSYGSTTSLGTITDEDVASSPKLAVGENAAVLAGDEGEQEEGGIIVKVGDVPSTDRAPSVA